MSAVLKPTQTTSSDYVVADLSWPTGAARKSGSPKPKCPA